MSGMNASLFIIILFSLFHARYAQDIIINNNEMLLLNENMDGGVVGYVCNGQPFREKLSYLTAVFINCTSPQVNYYLLNSDVRNLILLSTGRALWTKEFRNKGLFRWSLGLDPNQYSEFVSLVPGNIMTFHFNEWYELQVNTELQKGKNYKFVTPRTDDLIGILAAIPMLLNGDTFFVVDFFRGVITYSAYQLI